MTKTLDIGWGVCAPLRYPKHVAPLLEPYHVNVLNWTEYEEPGIGTGVKITVSDAAAKWAEYLICRSGKFSLISEPLEPKNIEWARKWQNVPVQRGCDAHTVAGTMGRMPTSWADKAKAQESAGGWLSRLFSPPETPRRKARRTARRAR